MIEMKVFLYLLLTNFTFMETGEKNHPSQYVRITGADVSTSLPNSSRVNRILTRPYIARRFKEGSQCPLLVKTLRQARIDFRCWPFSTLRSYFFSNVFYIAMRMGFFLTDSHVTRVGHPSVTFKFLAITNVVDAFLLLEQLYHEFALPPGCLQSHVIVTALGLKRPPLAPHVRYQPHRNSYFATKNQNGAVLRKRFSMRIGSVWMYVYCPLTTQSPDCDFQYIVLCDSLSSTLLPFWHTCLRTSGGSSVPIGRDG